MPFDKNILATLNIENDCIMVVDSHLDNYLKPINDFPNLHLSHYPNDLFDTYDYFWDRLHDGDDKYSMNYANIYMAYLFHHLNIDVVNILYQNYLKTLQGELGLICYWQKEWLNYIFKVKSAKELRQVDKKQWIDTITNHLTTFKSQTPPNTH
ncbi:hypothetical protein [Moraxella oblonga]|uniref:hypothetical protein n=1 Tax=Moraxella oblonga TaxID=200413 RepID=UPI000833DCDA|nr:hypothetical protein [Moraxella oblonga]